MKFLKYIYEKLYKKQAPYYYNYSIITIIKKPIIKYLNVVIIPNIPFNNIRIIMYRCLGYTIGKNVFIGMKCYLDDLCRKEIVIEDNVTISYGVYFACHGKNQSHNTLLIKNGVYIGMRSNIISKNENGLVIGENAIIGAGTLVNKNVPSGMTVVGVPGHVLINNLME